ncbi:MarR family winged helix-turn-helix transcriptional regulator [Noviherbaspirillum pedocola]|uniref:MarR family transcriptional regulator n=1 Tax=Noviherbaspirillum pedocola TaxID=2801341 RepID=A0A934T0P8_9BURK|nr:MarR family transcriptional regulator [Noviherbaspirillum pedocola]MBK4739249.1 MarR family transcriptional regulator [Noviherbaspirillum pedocola]
MTAAYQPENFSPNETIGFLLKRALIQLTATVDKALTEFDMTHAQLGIFLRLVQGHANTAADLAREISVDTGAMTRMLDRLEDKDYIRRVRSDTDRRVIEVCLAEKGKLRADRMSQVAFDALNHYLRDFSPEEIDQLKGFLRRVINNT